MKHLLTFILILLSISLPAQTFTFSGFPAGATTYANIQNGITMTATISTSGGSSWSNLTGTTSPNYATYAPGGCPSQTGLFLATNRTSTTQTVSLEMSFSSPICSPVTFKIYDINGENVDVGMGYGFRDDVTVSAWDGFGTPLLLTTAMLNNGGASSCNGGSYGTYIHTSGNNLVMVGCTYNNCYWNTYTLTSPNTISKIRIDYASGNKDWGGATITDPNIQYIIISDITSTPLNVPVNSPVICVGSTPTITANATAGSSYVWNTGATTSSISPAGLPAGTYTYTVTATDPNGCRGTATSTVTVNNPPIAVNVTPAAPLICSGSTTSLTASGASNYTWNTGATTAGIAVSPGITTTYSVTGTNPGCPGLATGVTVTVNSTPTVTATGGGTVCSGQSLTLNAGGTASTYLWSPATGLNTTTGSSVIASPGTSTTYTVTGTAIAPNTCTNLTTVNVSVNPSPILTAAASPTSICPGTSVDLASTGTVSPVTLFSEDFESGNSLSLVKPTSNYWTRGSTGQCPGSNNSLYISTNGTNYSYFNFSTRVSHAYFDINIPASYSSANLSFRYKVVGEANADDLKVYSCLTSFTPAVNNATITGTLLSTFQGSTTTCPLPLATIPLATGITHRIVFSWRNNNNSIGSTPAFIDNILVTATPAMSYTWSSNPSGFSSTVEDPGTVTPATTTTYTVTATSGGCTSTVANTVTVNPRPIPAPTSVCDGTDIDFSASDGVSYSWTGPNGFSSNLQSPVIAAAPPEANGTYTVTVTNSYGCTALATVDASCPPPLPIELLEFSGTVRETENQLFWSTASELNNATFTLERSGNAVDFSMIGTLPGAGNSNHVLNYTMTDPEPLINSYYRLKQTDYDGTRTYSDIILLSRAGNLSGITLFPNPSEGTFYLTINASQAGTVPYRVTDILGRTVREGSFELKEHSNTCVLEMNNINNGSYYLNVDHKTIRLFKL